MGLGGFLPNDSLPTLSTGSVAQSSRELLEKLAHSDAVKIDLMSQLEVAPPFA